MLHKHMEAKKFNPDDFKLKDGDSQEEDLDEEMAHKRGKEVMSSSQ
jgi:hypothetical protein